MVAPNISVTQNVQEVQTTLTPARVPTGILQTGGQVFGQTLTVAQAAGVAPVDYAIGIDAGATANTAAIQLALNAGSAKLLTPGIVEINSRLSAPDNSELYIGPGVTLRLASGSNCSMLANSRFSDASLATITLSLATSINVTATWTAHGQPVGSSRWLSIAGATQHEYNGVWFCKFTTANAFTDILESDPGTAATGTINVRFANFNIKVWGPGTVDFNGANNVNNTTLHENHAFKFLNAAVLLYDVRSNRNVTKFTVLFSNCAEAATGDLYFNTLSDGVHITGPSRGVHSIGNLSGYCGDDMLALTCGDYPGYQLSVGEIGYVKTGTIRGDNSAISLIKMTGAGGPKIRTVDVGGLMGTSQGGAVIITEDGVNLTQTKVDHLIIRHVGLRGFSLAVVYTARELSGSTVVDRLTIGNLRMPELLYGDRCIVRALDGTTINKVDIIDSQCEFGATSTGDVVRVDSGATISTTRLRGFNYIPVSSSNAAVRNAGTATTVMLEGFETVGNTAGYVVAHNANNTMNLYIDNARTSTTNSPVISLLSGSTINCYSSNWTHSGSGAVYSVTGSTINWFGDCICSTSPAPVGSFRASGTMYIDGANITAPATGDTFNNTNAGFSAGVGFYARTAAAAWTRLA